MKHDKSNEPWLAQVVTSPFFKFLSLLPTVSGIDPGLGSLLALGISGIESILKLRHEWWLHKLCQYIEPFKDVTDAEMEEYASRLKDEAIRHRVGAALLELELLESDKKANWLGWLTLAYFKKRFDADMFDALRYSIRNSYVQDLKELRKFYQRSTRDPNYRGYNYENQVALQRLAGIGLLSGPGTALGGVSLYSLNEYGRLMVENALKDDDE